MKNMPGKIQSKKKGFYQTDMRNLENKAKYQRAYNEKHKAERVVWHKVNEKKYLKTWEGFIPQKTQCQMCLKDIVFNSGKQSDSIHFDHRQGGEEAIKRPTAFLRTNTRTPEKEKLWKSCNFGMLCLKCNASLPTKDRKQFLENLKRYVNLEDGSWN